MSALYCFFNAAKRCLSFDFKSVATLTMAVSEGAVVGWFADCPPGIRSDVLTNTNASLAWLCSVLIAYIRFPLDMIFAPQPFGWAMQRQNLLPSRLKWNSKQKFWKAAFMPPTFVVTNSSGYDGPLKSSSTAHIVRDILAGFRGRPRLADVSADISTAMKIWIEQIRRSSDKEKA